MTQHRSPIWYSLSKQPYTSRAEENTICELAAKGDRRAMNEIILHNLRFVIMISARFSCDTLDQDDLVSEGVRGLQRAVQSFDTKRGNKFITYAVWWIRSYITRAIDNANKFPSVKRTQQRRAIKAHVDALKKYNSTALRKKDLDVDWMLDNRHLFDDVASAAPQFYEMDAPSALEVSMGIDNPKFIFNELTVRQEIDTNDSILPFELYELIDQIEDYRVRKVITAVYTDGSELTLRDIGKQFGISHERVRQLKLRGLKLLKDAINKIREAA